MKHFARIFLGLLLAGVVGACTRTATEPTASPPAASVEVKTDTVPTPTQSTTQGDTLCRGGGVVVGGGRTCDPT